MTPCAKINLFLNAEDGPTVQFEPTEEFLALAPVKQALMAHAGVQIGMAVVKQIMAENPDAIDAIIALIGAAELQPGTPRPN